MDGAGNDLLSLETAKAEKARLAKAKKGGAPVARSSKVTFSHYADAWLPLQTDLAPRTVEDYRLKLERLKPHLDIRLSNVNEAALSKAIGALRTAYAPNTLANTLVPLSCLLDDAVAEGLLGYNPLAALKARQSGRRQRAPSSPRLGTSKLSGSSPLPRLKSSSSRPPLSATGSCSIPRSTQAFGKWSYSGSPGGTLTLRRD